MRKIALSLAAAVVLAAPASAGTTTTVKVDDNFFKPAKVTIKKGDKVVWRWVGSNPHNVKLKKPDGSKGPTSAIKTSGKYSYTFRRTGTWRYVCVVHRSTMTGKVIVRN